MFVDPIEQDAFKKYIHISKYSRFLEEEHRRETWEETVKRYVDHMDQHLAYEVGFDLDDLRDDIFSSIYNLEAMPSMRALMTAGKALERSGISAYNCSYTPVDSIETFDEILYILTHGSGVGFSVERRYIDKLPKVPNLIYKSYLKENCIVVGDSKEGWAIALRELITSLYKGVEPWWDTWGVRPAGSPLKTFGGYASGPEPLIELFEFVCETFRKAEGRKLTPKEVFDIVCYIGRVIVSGGVRRSALICLCDLDDMEMATAKTGNWRENYKQRDMANISAVYEGKPGLGTFLKEWANLHDSYSGERGIFNRKAAQEQARKMGYRDPDQEFGCNPCGEIILPPRSFCNLSEPVIREDDTIPDIFRKVRIATIIGTIQATIDNFPYLRSEWVENVERERLLGVSLTGIFSNKILNGTTWNDPPLGLLEDLKNYAREVNKFYSNEFGINPSAAITCVKPSGTVSLLNGCSAGLHPWYSEYYIRSVRGNNIEPMTKFMKDSGIPNEPDLQNHNVSVFYFPMKAPEGAITRDDLTAIDHLEHWLRFKKEWTEHNPSITVQVKEHEWIEVAGWVYKHFDEVGGLSFLPYDTGSYRQAPFEITDKETYEKLKDQLPEMNWDDLKYYETYDSMDNSKELACSGADSCAVMDVGKVE